MLKLCHIGLLVCFTNTAAKDIAYLLYDIFSVKMSPTSKCS